MTTDTKKPPPPTVPMKPTEAQTQVAKRGDVPAVLDLEEIMKAKMAAVSRNDFYKVASKKNDQGQWEDVLAPNARVLQKWANENGGHPIKTKILETMETKDGCSVKVRAGSAKSTSRSRSMTKS